MKTLSITISISAFMVALFLLFGTNPELLVWTQSNGQLWRLVSGHFVHISSTHLIWNLAAFLVLGSIIERHSKRLLLASLCVGMVGVNLFLTIGFSLPAYAGLSGVLNTLLVVTLYQLAQDNMYRSAALLTLVASMAKIVIEMLSGHSMVSQLTWPPVPEAHLIGWVSGAALCLVIFQHDRVDQSNLTLSAEY